MPGTVLIVFGAGSAAPAYVQEQRRTEIATNNTNAHVLLSRRSALTLTLSLEGEGRERGNALAGDWEGNQTMDVCFGLMLLLQVASFRYTFTSGVGVSS